MKEVIYILVGLLAGCVVVNIDDAPPCDKRRVDLFGYVLYESCEIKGRESPEE